MSTFKTVRSVGYVNSYNIVGMASYLSLQFYEITLSHAFYTNVVYDFSMVDMLQCYPTIKIHFHAKQKRKSTLVHTSPKEMQVLEGCISFGEECIYVNLTS